MTTLSRRTALAGVLAAAAAVVLDPLGASAEAATRRRRLPRRKHRPVARRRRPVRRRAPAPHPAPAPPPSAAPGWERPLLQRFTYGASPAALEQAGALGSPQAWLERQLDPASLPDPEGDAVRALFPELGWSVTDVRARVKQFDWDAMFAVGQATVALAALSRRQLLEQMTAFWSNHLNVTCPSDNVWDNRPSYDAVVRAHALGRFDDLLVATATHPAMLRFLNNADSTKDAPNENYGRELLELHTVGIDAGYTEAMIKDSARIMTGWTVADATGLATYDPTIHATGPVAVLDFAHPNGDSDGRAVVEAYLRYLAHHPATARRIARKLAVRFVADDPPAALVDDLARTYLDAGTDIRPVLRRLVLGPEWAQGRKLKTPYDDVVSTVRVLGIGLAASATAAKQREGMTALYWTLDGLRAAPLAWHPPDGYPDVAVRWMATDLSLGRWNAHQNIAAAWWPDRTMLAIPESRSLLPATLPTTYGALVDALSARLLGGPLPTAARAAVVDFTGHTADAALPPDDEWLGWRLPSLVSLVLDTPAFAERT